jgi:hypothetical protein
MLSWYGAPRGSTLFVGGGAVVGFGVVVLGVTAVKLAPQVREPVSGMVNAASAPEQSPVQPVKE